LKPILPQGHAWRIHIGDFSSQEHFRHLWFSYNYQTKLASCSLQGLLLCIYAVSLGFGGNPPFWGGNGCCWTKAA